jgi:hypothetical protein
MAPEQVGINALDVDTRTDIYALGVILYELLVGSTPLEKARYKEATWDEVKRLIREEEPPRPSTRLSSSASLASLAASRQVEPAKLPRLVRGELDWIVMKALEKDRSRRYETANGFAMDVQRYLAGEPVLAVPPSTGYRLKKFVRRHKGRVVAVSAVLLAFIGGFVGITIGLLEARRQSEAAEAARKAEAEERARAVAERDEKEKALAEADTAKKRANEEAAIARAVTEFLQHNLLWQTDTRHQFVDPSRLNRKPNITVRELLDRAASTVGEKFKDQPLVEAAIRFTVADTYVGMNLWELALPHAREAVKIRQEKWADAEPLLRTCLDIRRRKDSDSWFRFNAQLLLGVALLGQRKPDEAAPLLREGYEGVKQREAKISRTGKILLHETVGFLVALCDAAGQTQEAARWRKELETTRAYVQNAAEAWRPYALLRTGKTARAIARTAELTKKATWNSLHWYNFACVYAVASSRIVDKKQEYANRAMELLHQAVKAGYDDAAHVAEDPDLHPLRQRDDFKKLQGELAKAAKR